MPILAAAIKHCCRWPALNQDRAQTKQHQGKAGVLEEDLSMLLIWGTTLPSDGNACHDLHPAHWAQPGLHLHACIRTCLTGAQMATGPEDHTCFGFPTHHTVHQVICCTPFILALRSRMGSDRMLLGPRPIVNMSIPFTAPGPVRLHSRADQRLLPFIMWTGQECCCRLLCKARRA